MIVSVDLDSPLPPYEQIRAQITTMAASGVLPPGSRLPAIRQLAAALGLAASTAARAYRTLATGSPMRVSDGSPPGLPHDRQADVLHTVLPPYRQCNTIRQVAGDRADGTTSRWVIEEFRDNTLRAAVRYWFGRGRRCRGGRA